MSKDKKDKEKVDKKQKKEKKKEKKTLPDWRDIRFQKGKYMRIHCKNATPYLRKHLPAIRVSKKSLVLDLGCGGGFDCFLAAKQVGENGHVIGIDMTPDMISKARENARRGTYHNVEFRLGEIECLPVTDNSVDVIISNCVINLSPEKTKVFQEAYRILKPGGRLAISDVVALCELPESIKNDREKQCSCIGGAATVEELKSILERTGFNNVKIQIIADSKGLIKGWFPESNMEDYVRSASIEASK